MSTDATRCLICGATADPGRLTEAEFLLDRFFYAPVARRPRPQRLEPTTCERHVMRHARTKADIEYAVMLAVLNFHTEFMRANYTHVQVQMLDDVIDVLLTNTSKIPAEELLARTAEGEALLRDTHEAVFRSCQEVLKERIEQVIGRSVKHMSVTVDPRSGKTGIIIGLQESSLAFSAPAVAGADERA